MNSIQQKLNTTQKLITDILDLDCSIGEISQRLRIERKKVDSLLGGDREATDFEYGALLILFCQLERDQWRVNRREERKLYKYEIHNDYEPTCYADI